MRSGEVSTRGWWGGARGCGLIIAILGTVLALVGGWVVSIRPLHQAVEARESLAELYGSQGEFTPPGDGAVAAERMQDFLGVRERLAESCDRLTESSLAIDYVEDLEWLQQSPKRGNSFASLWERGRAAIGLEPRRGEFWRARNEALLDAGMSLGEYTYIFVLAYSSDLVAYRQGEGHAVVEGVRVLPRVRRILLETLRRQLLAVEAGRPGPDGNAWAKELASEIARLEQDPLGIPWTGGLPAHIGASIAPYRQHLDAVRCEATLHLELIRNERKGLSIHGH